MSQNLTFSQTVKKSLKMTSLNWLEFPLGFLNCPHRRASSELFSITLCNHNRQRRTWIVIPHLWVKTMVLRVRARQPLRKVNNLNTRQLCLEKGAEEDSRTRGTQIVAYRPMLGGLMPRFNCLRIWSKIRSKKRRRKSSRTRSQHNSVVSGLARQSRTFKINWINATSKFRS